MPFYVFLALMAAALGHASWNALLKSDGRPWDNVTALSYATALLSLVVVLFLPAPAMESWPYILASGGVQFFYMKIVSKVYKRGDYAVGYPLMRGLSPPFTALAGFLFLHEAINPIELAGLLGISCGVLMIGFSSIRDLVRFRKQFLLALFCGMMISYFALVDGTGVRLSHAPIAYTLWIFILQGMGVFLFRLIRKEGVSIPLGSWKPWVGATLSAAAYAVALWAMTLAPIATVAALRESSIFFSALIGLLFLREKPSLFRVLGALFIAGGVIAFRLAL